MPRKSPEELNAKPAPKKVDAEVKKIVDKGYERARKILTEKYKIPRGYGNKPHPETYRLSGCCKNPPCRCGHPRKITARL